MDHPSVSSAPRPRTKDALVTHMRPFVEGDIDQIIDLVSEALPTLPNYKGMKVNAGRLRYVLTNNTASNASFWCCVLIDEGEVVGGMAAWASPTIFSFDTVCYDVFLYIKPEYRSLKRTNDLLRGYVAWAKARGASIIKASNTGGIDIAPIMVRLGFVPVGTVYHWRDK